MIVGNGLIGTAFRKQKIDDSIIIFASGVSNSQEKNPIEYNREFELLKFYLSKNTHIVYFSTTSVYDESLRETEYVKHKIRIEKYIIDNANSFNIFRLPIVVGFTKNKLTLIQFLYEKIIKNEPLDVFINACRSLIDVDDLSFIVSEILKKNIFVNEITDVYLTHNTPILEIINCLEHIVKKKIEKNIIHKGTCYEIHDSKIKLFLKSIDFKFEDDYTCKTINKYYGTK